MKFDISKQYSNMYSYKVTSLLLCEDFEPFVTFLKKCDDKEKYMITTDDSTFKEHFEYSS